MILFFFFFSFFFYSFFKMVQPFVFSTLFSICPVFIGFFTPN